jgi:hypothetical protein
MKEDTKKLFRELWYYSSLSFSIALSIVIGLGASVTGSTRGYLIRPRG